MALARIRVSSFLLIIALVAGLAGFNSCTRHPIESPEQAMRLVPESSDIPALSDDLPIQPLLKAVNDEIRFMESIKNPAPMRFGPRLISQADYLAGLRRFVELGESARTAEDFYREVRNEFDFYEVYGKKDWGDVFITSYYEPLLKGSLRRHGKYTQPLYSTPRDLVSLDLSLFDPKYAGDRTLRGRLDGNRLLPYYTREEIDSKNALHGHHLEICWVDPIDAFFLQIQGSGEVQLDNGQVLQVNYAEKNGQRYEAIGNFLKDKIPADQMNLASIEAYLRTLSPDDLQKLLDLNPSYVFFKVGKRSAVTTLGVPATDGRTIATDPKLFPKGALAFLISSKPVFADSSSTSPTRFAPMSRFVLDQDTGGAIQGPGRLDLFWGRGSEAKRAAGFMKQRGTLYYLVPKIPDSPLK